MTFGSLVSTAFGLCGVLFMYWFPSVNNPCFDTEMLELLHCIAIFFCVTAIVVAGFIRIVQKNRWGHVRISLLWLVTTE